MEITQWDVALGLCTYDESVGIKILKLAGNEDFSTYLTSIDPGKSVNPHYHRHGDEHYHIILGTGEIELTNIKSKECTITSVIQHSSFVVCENVVHQLKNTGIDKMILMFSCPQDHLVNDRYFINISDV